MRLFLSLSTAVVFAILVLTACNSNEGKNSVASNGEKPATVSTPKINPPSDGVRRITTVELRDAVASGSAFIVDVRPAVSYKENHIKGAVHIPLEEVATRLGELPRDKIIVTYCS